jgi:exonuclease SbcD
VKILHTSDWHVGKTIRGHSRLDEHRAVLAEIVALARAEAVDVVAVAGDLYESAAPSAEAEQVVLQALLDLRATGAAVVVVAGNHDNPGRFEAIRPVMAELGITVLGHVRRPDDGGVAELAVGAERVQVALLPFVSQRYSVRAAELMAHDAAANAGLYAERLRGIIGALTAGFSADSVNVLVAHGMVRGGKTGGGERDAQTAFEDYWLDASAFPSSATYVALGHLHLAQAVPAGPPVRYSGSPIQVDFGEAGAGKHVLIVEASAGRPARVREVALRAGASLRTLVGTLGELEAVAAAEDLSDTWLRVVVTEPARSGLADDVRALLGERAVEVRLERPELPEAPRAERRGRGPHVLFAAFLAEQGVEDERLLPLFAALLDEELTEPARGDAR